MKKLIILFLLFTIFGTSQAQNAISLTFQPVDLGIGLKYDHYFKVAGLYIAGAYGNYKLYNQSIDDHIRISAGITAPLQNARIGIGVVYHQFGEVDGEFPDKTLDPISFELGASAYRKWFSAGLRYDFIKHESCIDIGVNF